MEVWFRSLVSHLISNTASSSRAFELGWRSRLDNEWINANCFSTVEF